MVEVLIYRRTTDYRLNAKRIQISLLNFQGVSVCRLTSSSHYNHTLYFHVSTSFHLKRCHGMQYHIPHTFVIGHPYQWLS